MDNEKLKILRLLIENQEKTFSMRQISKLRKINYKSAYLAIKKLAEEKVIELKKIGNTTNCSFNKRFNLSVFNVEYLRRKELLNKKEFKIIYNSIKDIKSGFICLVFGSSISKNLSKNSDIDLLIISEKEDKIKETLNLIPLNIHLTIISYEEFIQMIKSKEFSVVSEVIKKNIILNGIEEYYRFLEAGLNVK
jgi:predicted nucleotidyltransferase